MKKRLFTLLMVLALCLSLAPAAFADSSVTYKGQAEKFVFAPGSDYSPTDLFENFKGVMPGDTLTQKIDVRNAADEKVNVKIYMRALGAKEGSEEFLSQMTLNVKAADGAELFDAPADQTAQLSDWVCLGTFKSGANTALDVNLNVPVTMGDDFQQAIGYLDWEFMVEEFPVDDTNPKTGDETPIALYVTVCAVSAAVIILLLLTRRKKEEQ